MNSSGLMDSLWREDRRKEEKDSWIAKGQLQVEKILQSERREKNKFGFGESSGPHSLCKSRGTSAKERAMVQ